MPKNAPRLEDFVAPEEPEQPQTPAEKKTKRNRAFATAGIAVVAAVLVAVGFAQAGQLPSFTNMANWESGLYSNPERGFQSNALQLQQADNSDNKLQENNLPDNSDDQSLKAEENTGALSGASQGSQLATSVTSDSSIVAVGTGGTTEGGSAADGNQTPSGTGSGNDPGSGGSSDGGGGSDGNGGGTTEPLPEIINPGRIEQPANPADEGTGGGTANADTMDSLTLTPKPGCEDVSSRPVLYGQEITCDMLDQYYVATASFTKSNGETYTKDVTSDVRFGLGTWQQEAGTRHVIGDEADGVDLNGIAYVRVIYSESGSIVAVNKSTATVTFESYDHKANVEMPTNTAGDTEIKTIWTDDSTADLSAYLTNVVNSYCLPDEKGYVHNTFNGWSLEEGGDPVGSSVTFDARRGSEVELRSLGFITIPEAYLVRNINDELTLVGYTGSDSCVAVPAGVTRVALEEGHVNTQVTTLELGDGVSHIDFSKMEGQWPSLAGYSVQGSSSFICDEAGNLYAGSDKNDCTLLRVVPEATSITVPFGAATLDKDAFADCSSSIHITFQADEPPLGGEEAIPDAATVTVMDSDGDITLKAYLAAWGDDGFALDSADHAAYKYKYDNGTVLSADGTTIEYVPRTYLGSYSTPSSITKVGYAAFVVAESLGSVTLGASVVSVDDYAFAGLYSANALVVKNAAALAAQEGFSSLKLFPDASYEYDPESLPGVYSPSMSDNFMLYLPGVTPGDATYNAWLDQLAAPYGDKAASHISCQDMSIWSNPSDNALYSIGEDGTYTLIRLPKAATHFDALDDGKVLVEVDERAFEGCASIKLIELPQSCTTIASNAFEGCAALEVLYSLNADSQSVQALFAEDGALSKQALGAAGCQRIKLAGTALSYSRHDYAFYTKGSQETRVRSAEGVTLMALVSDFAGELDTLAATDAVADGACFDCQGLTGIALHPAANDAVTVGEAAFSGCEKLKAVPNVSFSSIGAQAFLGCLSLGQVELTAANLTLGDAAFQGCNGLAVLSISGTVDALGSSVCEGLASLSSVLLDVTPASGQSGSLSLGQDMFKDCTSLARAEVVAPPTSKITIAQGMFQNCKQLSLLSISLDNAPALVGIGDHAFDGCTNLLGFSTTMDSCPSVAYVGDYAFYDCPNLTNLVFSGACTSVGAYAYALSDDNEVRDRAATTGYTSAQGHLSISSFGDYAFKNRKALATAYYGQSSVPVYFGEGAFYGCTSLNFVDLENAVSFGDGIFYGCSQLSSLTLSHTGDNALSSLGEAAFYGCSSLTSLSFKGETFTAVEANAFRSCTSLMSLTLPATVSSIGPLALSGCTDLTSLTLESTSVVQIDPDALGTTLTTGLMVWVPLVESGDDGHALRDAYRADENWQAAFGEDVEDIVDVPAAEDGQVYFEGGLYQVNADGTHTLVQFDSTWTGLVALMSTTTAIADGAFSGCNQIMTAVIPASVTTIGSYIFSGCTALEAVAFNPVKAPTFATDIFDAGTAVNKNFRLYVKGGDSASYYGSLTQLEEYPIVSAGERFTTLTKCIYTNYLTDGEEMTVLSYMPRAFAGSVRIAPATAYIADGACEGCTGLTDFYSRTSLIGIGKKAFKDCTGLKSANVSNSTVLTSTGATQTNANNSLSRIGDYAFQGCTSLTKAVATAEDSTGMTLPMYIDTVGKGIFEGCTSLTKCAWYAYTAISDETFMNCSAFTTLSLGEKSKEYVDGYGDRAFMNCVSLDPLTVGNLSTTGNLTYIGAECYRNTKLALVVLPSSITRIGADAFTGCDSLESFAFNGAECPTFEGALMSDATWKNAHVYVPSGTKDTYLAAWAANRLETPTVVEASAAHYRPISGNIYAQESDPSVGDKNMMLMATTNTTLEKTTAVISLSSYGKTYDGTGSGLYVYRGTTASYFVTSVAPSAFKGNQNMTVFISCRNMKTIGESAFEGSALVAVDLARGTSNGSNAEAITTVQAIGASAFKDCTSLEYVSIGAKTASIGDGAFANTSDDLLIDCNRNMSTSISYCVINPPTLGSKVFGDTLPANLRISTDADATGLFLASWGKQLKAEYGIDDKRLAEIFGVTEQDVIAVIGEGINAVSLADEALDTLGASPTTTEAEQAGAGEEAASGATDDAADDAAKGAVDDAAATADASKPASPLDPAEPSAPTAAEAVEAAGPSVKASVAQQTPTSADTGPTPA